MDLILAQVDLVFVERLAQFNLYVLPLLVAAVLVRALRAGWRSGVEDRRLDRERAVRWVGLVNYGLAAHSVLKAVPDLVDLVRFGGFPTFPVTSVFWPLIAAVVLVPIGIGLRRLRGWARWAEVVLNLFVVPFILLAGWVWSFGATFDIANWPDLAVTYVLPFFLAFAMLLPGTARVCSAEYRAAIADRPGGPGAVRLSTVSALTLIFLVLVVVIVIEDAANWLILYGSEMMNGSGN